MGIFNKLLSWVTPGKQTASVVSDGADIWYNSTGHFVDTAAGERVSESNLMSSATCFACTKALSESVAGLPAAVYREKDETKEEDPTSEAWRLLISQPNPEMDWFTFLELMVARVMNNGNFFAEIQRDGADRPVALWPIHPSRVTPVRDTRDMSLFWEIHHDHTGDAELTDPTWRKKHLSFLTPHNMLNIVGFGSSNGIIGNGVIPGAQEIGLEFAARRYGANFFDSGASPIGVVEHPGFIQAEGQRNQFRNDLNQIHNNKNGSNQIGVLWQGAQYKQISLSPEQAQFLETRKFSSHQICKLYGVPPAIIGDYEHSKFATADAMIRAFVMVTLRNLVVRIERAINRQVLNVTTEDGRLKRAFTKPQIYEMALDGLLRGDPKMQAETWKLMRDSGTATANEWRDSIGMNPINGPEGDFLIVPGGFTRLDQIDNQGTRPENELPPPQEPEEEPEEPEEEPDEPEEEPTENEALRLSVIDAVEEVFTRIHANTKTQVSRWKNLDPEEMMSKTDAFSDKQGGRLVDALKPIQGMANAAKINMDSQEIASNYVALLKSLEFGQWFEADKYVGDIKAFLESEIR
jgi:HK97 family phage portal protein